MARLVGHERKGRLGAGDYVDVDSVAIDEEAVGDVRGVEDEGDGVALFHVDDAGVHAVLEEGDFDRPLVVARDMGGASERGDQDGGGDKGKKR